MIIRRFGPILLIILQWEWPPTPPSPKIQMFPRIWRILSRKSAFLVAYRLRLWRVPAFPTFSFSFRFSRYWFSKTYHTASRSQRFPTLIFQEILSVHANPKLSKIIQKVSKVFQTYFRFTRIYLGFKIIKRFQDLKDVIEILGFPCFFKTIVNAHCVRPANNHFQKCWYTQFQPVQHFRSSSLPK